MKTRAARRHGDPVSGHVVRVSLFRQDVARLKAMGPNPKAALHSLLSAPGNRPTGWHTPPLIKRIRKPRQS